MNRKVTKIIAIVLAALMAASAFSVGIYALIIAH